MISNRFDHDFTYGCLSPRGIDFERHKRFRWHLDRHFSGNASPSARLRGIPGFDFHALDFPLVTAIRIPVLLYLWSGQFLQTSSISLVDLEYY